MGNIPSSAFDGNGGYVYIMGANGRLLRVYNKVTNSYIGNSTVNYFINNPNSHVIISQSSIIGAGGTTFTRSVTEKQTYTELTSFEILSNMSELKKTKYFEMITSFEGAVLQPGVNYLVSIDVNNNTPHFSLEAAFHEMYTHAFAREMLGVMPEESHYHIGGSGTGRYDHINKVPYLRPDNILPIEQFLYEIDLNNIFFQYFDMSKLKFGKTEGRATKVEKIKSPRYF